MRPIHLLPLFLAAPAFAQLRLEPIAHVDLSTTAVPSSGHYIGSHPSAIAWNGLALFVAGMNQGGAASVGIVRIADVETTPTFEPTFGSITGTPTGFGYTGLDVGIGLVVASYDDGAVHPLGLRAFSSIDLSTFWSFPMRGSSGVVIDLGFGGSGGGIAWTSIGADRFALNDFATGGAVYTLAFGMILNPGGTASWRDLSRDWSSGDLYGRKGNDVTKAQRTSDNGCIPSLLVDLTDADAIPTQNVAFMNVTVGNYVIFNDRTSTSAGQSFFDVVKVATTAGAPVTIDWAGHAPPTGTGAYDFSWIQFSQTVAVLDVANHAVTIFKVGLTPSVTPVCFGDGSGTACPCANLGAVGKGCANSVHAGGAQLASSGVPSISSDTLVLSASSMPNGSALFFQGTALTNGGNGSMFGDGLRCAGGTVVRLATRPTTGSAQYPGSGEASVSVRGGVAPGTRHYQVWYRDTAAFCTSQPYNLSNALSVVWGS